MHCLLVTFRLRDEAAAAEFDAVVEEAVPQIASEPGTLVYATHMTDEEPLSRIFYEVYRDIEAWRLHGEAPYVASFLARAEELLAEPPDVQVLEVGPFTGWAVR
jgi:quinol monooxygenase YgiN